jgi:RadC-like JAB domain
MNQQAPLVRPNRRSPLRFIHPTARREDREIPQRLAQAGALLGVSLLDSVVSTRKDGFVALRELETSLFDRA